MYVDFAFGQTGLLLWKTKDSLVYHIVMVRLQLSNRIFERLRI